MTYKYSNDQKEIEYYMDLDYRKYEILINLILLYLDTSLNKKYLKS